MCTNVAVIGMSELNKTHDPAAKSWVDSANTGITDFPIQNLPFGVFSVAGGDKHIGVAIGDQILDLTMIEQRGLVRPDGSRTVFDRAEINAFMALGPQVWRETRAAIFDLLHVDSHDLRDDAEFRDQALVAMSEATMHLPVYVRSYTDFYASKEHATNVGTMFRGPDNALPPNWLHMPIGYNGRASTVVVSGTDIRRPWGQLKSPDDDAPRFAPCGRFDIELELGAIVGTPTELGETLTVVQAYEKIFGYVLLNDWSARDIQTWEYQPLGPFQSKATATTISPWVITRDALEPFRVSTPERLKPLLPYLQEETPNNFDIEMEIILRRAVSRRRSAGPTIATCTFRARSSWRIMRRRAAPCALVICWDRARYRARIRAVTAHCSNCPGAASNLLRWLMGRCDLFLRTTIR